MLFQLTEHKNTALHAAVSFGYLNIVENLVNLMTEAEMEMTDTDGYIALASAALTGITEIAECIIQKNENLVIIPNNSDEIPVTLAVLSGHIKMAHYLYLVTPLRSFFPENGHHGAMLLKQCFLSN
ncbi:hypothetical protein L6164_008614 [Bauhinia variegata]|uniref:Uncharacterized protein n=1 Tax=Bauhinia variegata TaxID=167791 RepID=A0ACB9PH11_BAUVA|nr:hypothetical protein L6164_008614 [Bauhinia variegata]